MVRLSRQVSSFAYFAYGSQFDPREYSYENLGGIHRGMEPQFIDGHEARARRFQDGELVYYLQEWISIICLQTLLVVYTTETPLTSLYRRVPHPPRQTSPKIHPSERSMLHFYCRS